MSEWVRAPLIIFGTMPLVVGAMLAAEKSAWADLGLLVFVPAWVAGATWWLLQPAREDKRRERLGLCSSCGYDLTGNVSGVCPECGERVVA